MFFGRMLFFSSNFAFKIIFSPFSF
jgi:hypothetical protein